MTVNVVLVEPAGIKTVAGTLAGDVLVSLTVAPPLGAARERLTVPVVELPPMTGFGSNVSSLTFGGGTSQTAGVPPPPQISGDVQVPHAIHAPQPSGTAPQFLPCAAHVVGVHGPHTFGTPPAPQLCGSVQLPQVIVLPQPSEIVPQFLPSDSHVIGAHAGGGSTSRYAASCPVLRFVAWPTMTEPSAETAFAKIKCHPPVLTSVFRS